VFLEHVSQLIPGLAESKTSIRVKISVVEPNLNRHFLLRGLYMGRPGYTVTS
jgi:hypothetical protein